MKEEEKQLLLKDLCARLPYGVMCKLSAKGANISITEKLETGGLGHFIFGTMEALPYLRPMSSMTEEEKIEWDAEYAYNIHSFPYEQYLAEMVDWLNEHYFDYRGLIEKGLALEAPEGMYYG